MSQHVVHLAVRTEDTTMLHEWQTFHAVHGRWHPLHNGVAVPMKSEYSPGAFLVTHVASRGSNLTPFIWYMRHLRSGHMVTYIVKVHA